MPRRQRIVLQEDNQDRWLVSYADFITLLFAFFVVMYSISSVNVDKYRVLSDAMVSAFRQPQQAQPPLPVEQLAAADWLFPATAELDDSQPAALPPLRPVEPEPLAEPVTLSPEDARMQQALAAAEQEVDAIASDVEQGMDELIDQGIVDVKRNKFWLEVEIKSSLLFGSGSSALIPASVPILVELATAFASLPNRIHVEGFTDDQPISTPRFPSNWELSAARAAAVVRLFESNGVSPQRLASIGYGEYHPISDNGDAQGRAANRRVVVVVMASLEGYEGDRIYEFEMLKERTAALGQ